MNVLDRKRKASSCTPPGVPRALAFGSVHTKGMTAPSCRLPSGLTLLAGLCVVAATLCGAVPGVCDQALDILKKSIKADGDVRYSGTVEIRIYQNGKPLPTRVQRITRESRNRERIEVLAPDNEEGRLIVGDGSVEWLYRPRQRLVQRRQVFALRDIQKHKLEALDLVRHTLHATYLNTASVAGRRCHVVAVKPPNGQRTRKKIWIDAEHYVELKWERYDQEGVVERTWTMTSINFRPNIQADTFRFEPPPGCKTQDIPAVPRMSLREAEKSIGFKAIIPGYLPPGFALDKNRVRVVRRQRHSALWMEFINGVDSFSIFQSEHIGPHAQVPERAMYWEAQGFSFILVGPISQREKENIRDSTR